MEIEKLIEKLRTESLYKDKATLEIMDLCMDAALALEQLRDESEKLKAQVPRWIPVEERLPEEGKRCLLYTPCDGILCVGYYAGKDAWQHRHKWRLVTAMRSTQTLTKKVTHWRPLPEAPKEEKKDD